MANIFGICRLAIFIYLGYPISTKIGYPKMNKMLRPIRIEGEVCESTEIASVNYCLIYVRSLRVLMLDEFEFQTSFTFITISITLICQPRSYFCNSTGKGL